MQKLPLVKLNEQLAKFFKYDERGAFAVILALLLVPLMALAGGVIDYTNVSSVRSQMQDASDIATLAAARADKDDDDEMQQVAQDVFSENYDGGFLSGSLLVEATRIDDGVRVDVSSSVGTSFLKLIGISNFNVRVFSEVVDSLLGIEVVMVLDNTFSMDGQKMAVLKSSANLLIDELFSGSNTDEIKVGLVPFAQTVNIGMSNRNEPGIDVPADYTEPAPDWCRWDYPNSTRTCDRELEEYDCVVDGVETTCERWRYFNCTGDRGDREWVCSPRANYEFKWYGSMGSRDDPLNVRDQSYVADPVPGLMTRWNLYWALRPLTRLTSDEPTIRSAISNMRTRQSQHYSTYIPVGLIWGWRLLSNDIPFSDAMPYDDANKKVMVILTDGANTRSTGIGGYQWMLNQGAAPSNVDSWHYGNDVNDANDKTVELCENIKDDEIIVYTIAFDVSDPTIESILENCAGNGGSYYDADNSAELEEAFENIAEDLKDLRLSR